MREVTNREKILLFMRSLGTSARREARVYFTGGSTAVLQGWRDTTVDIDVRFIPEFDELFRALPKLKEKLHINIELASPPDFIPQLPGWEERSIFIAREGKIDFFHFDLYSQALAKIERDHSQDRSDVRTMFEKGFIDGAKVLDLFEKIEPELYRYPAINPKSFSLAVRRAVEENQS